VKYINHFNHSKKYVFGCGQGGNLPNSSFLASPFKTSEVIKMDELSTENIHNVFMNQIIALTKKTSRMNSFDYQFSDRWL